MEMKILKSSKDEVEVQVGSLTIAEILRVYLNKDSSVILAVWRRKHPTENPILLVKTNGKTAKKAIVDAISSINKSLDKVAVDFKGIK